ncbi:hypothetical protein [Pseudarthrobacter sp. WHRI 8279]|uniref:hypothetical protein n=1 Tax=Pseudarthrobacter sp. WHRI 8279 TaxID=3162566 RepID=UPI0032F04052
MAEFDEKWSALAGRTIELRRGGRLVRTAEVEDVSVDASMLWLRFHGNDRRKIIAQWEGYEINVVD